MVSRHHAQAQRLCREVLPALGERLAELAVFSAQEGDRTLEALSRLVAGMAGAAEERQDALDALVGLVWRIGPVLPGEVHEVRDALARIEGAHVVALQPDVHIE